MLSKKQQLDLVNNMQGFGIFGRLIGRMEISQLRHLLLDREDIEAMIYGVHEGSFVLMVATNQRLIFIDRGWFNSRIDDYQYNHLESVEYDLSLLSGMVKIFAAQGTIFLKFAPNRLIHNFVSILESHMGRSARPESSNIEQLERLATMHRNGDLSDAEFKSEKAKIINSK